jgi:uncharacterized protein YndB with AHSA1/START domain
MATQDKLHVYAERRFHAAPERVYGAWLEPSMLSRWMFGPAVREEHVVRLTVDARSGGSFSFVVSRQGEEVTHVGRYLQMDRPRRLVFTWGIGGVSEDQSRVTVDFLPSATGCELTLTHELRPHLAHYAARTESGWIKMLDQLATALDEPAS